MKKLAGKVAVVTGGGKGLGAAMSERLAEEGAVVALNYSSSAAESEETVKRIEAKGGKAFAYKADIAKQSEVQAFFAEVDKRLGNVDILVNNAGTSAIMGTDGSLLSITEEHFDRAFAANVKGVIFASQEAVKRFKPGSKLINIVSSSGDYKNANLTLYTASKYTPRAFTKVWARELAPKGITVNAVAPGPIDAGMMSQAPGGFKQMLADAHPFKRLGTAEEVAGVVAFLASNDSNWISGEIILVNGGGDG